MSNIVFLYHPYPSSQEEGTTAGGGVGGRLPIPPAVIVGSIAEAMLIPLVIHI